MVVRKQKKMITPVLVLLQVSKSKVLFQILQFLVEISCSFDAYELFVK